MAKCQTFKDLLVAITTGSREIEYCGPVLNDYQEKVLTQFLKQLPIKVVRLAIKTSPIRDEALGKVLVQIAQRPSILDVSVNASDKIKEQIELALSPKKSKAASRVGFQSPHLRSLAATSSRRQATISVHQLATTSSQQLATTSFRRPAKALSLRRTTSSSQLQADASAQAEKKIRSLQRTTSFHDADTSSVRTLSSGSPLKQVTSTAPEQSEQDEWAPQTTNQPVVNNGEDDSINSDHSSSLTTHETLSDTDDVDDDNGFAVPPPHIPAAQRESELARVIDGLSKLLQQEIEFHEHKLQRPLSMFFAQNTQQAHEETNNTLQLLKQLQKLINDSQPSTHALLKTHCGLLKELAQDIQGSNISSIDAVQLNITLQTLLSTQNQADRSPPAPSQEADTHTEAELATRPNKRPKTDEVSETDEPQRLQK